MDSIADFKGFVEWWRETYNPDVTEEDLVELAKENLINETGKGFISKAEKAEEAISTVDRMLEDRELLESVLNEKGETVESFIEQREKLMESFRGYMDDLKELREKVFDE